MWGLQPGFFSVLEDGFTEFLAQINAGDTKAEYLLPKIIGGLLRKGNIRVKVMESTDQWFGVTYREDKAAVADAMKSLVEKGVYPEKLF